MCGSVLIISPPILPPKKYYFPRRKKLLKFSIEPFKTAKAISEFEEYILFAVHTCDIAGIQCMDVVFRDGPEDPNYLNRKDKMSIIGIECLNYCDEYANCASMATNVPAEAMTWMLVDLGEKYILHINSEKGELLIKGGWPILKKPGTRIWRAWNGRGRPRRRILRRSLMPLTRGL